MAKYDEKTGLFTFNGAERFDQTHNDKDGYWHRMFTTKDGLVGHQTNRPQCLQCNHPLEIHKTDHSYTEICPICGQGTGSMW
jgi:hypothetical protein